MRQHKCCRCCRRHFSLWNFTDESFSMLMASTGQRATHEPQLKHFSESTSMSLGMLTLTPLFRNAFTIFSSASSGTSTSISPPLESMCADKMAIRTLYSRIISLARASGTCSSENLKSSRYHDFFRPKQFRYIFRCDYAKHFVFDVDNWQSGNAVLCHTFGSHF